MAPVTFDPLLGTVLADRYRVDRLIGEGAMGKVYQAEHVLMRKRVAIKVLHPELMTVPEIVYQFEREARAAAHIEHPHVAGATDFGKLPDGGIYLVLEYIEGVPLSSIILAGPVGVDRVLNIAGQIASALEAAHARNIVHRDLKPDNLLLLQTDDRGDFIKVLDFGIAKAPPEPHEGVRPIAQVGMVCGTPEYMAPEQALGQDVDGRADLYALGVVMFELLTGRRPYVGPAVGLLGQQLTQPVPKMSHVAAVSVPPAVEQLVTELLATDTKGRPPDAGTLRLQIETLLQALHEGRLAGTTNRSQALLSATFDDKSTRVDRASLVARAPVMKASGGVSVSRSALLTLLFLGFGVAGAVMLVGRIFRQNSDTQSAALQLTVPPPAIIEVPVPAPKFELKWEAARQQGIEALEALAKEFPLEGILRAELALSLAKAERYDEAVDSARLSLALDPELNENAKIAEALYRSAQSVKARAATFRLLQGAMGNSGVGIIYELANTKGLSPKVRQYAQQVLSTPEVRQSASPALLLAIDLSATVTCEEIKPLVSRAALVGDKRALPSLEALEVQVGCGRRKAEDCYPCLRGSDDLALAIQTIKQRVTLLPAEAEGPAPD